MSNSLTGQTSRRWVYYVIAVLCVVLVIVGDQWSKAWVSQHLVAGDRYMFTWLNLTLRYNRGAAFSFLSGASGWQVYVLAVIAIVVCMALLIWLISQRRPNSLQAVAVGLVIGGALGNLIDRLRFNHVIDFIDVHIGQWHYATFNVADSAITLGVILLLISFLVSRLTARSDDLED